MDSSYHNMLELLPLFPSARPKSCLIFTCKTLSKNLSLSTETLTKTVTSSFFKKFIYLFQMFIYLSGYIGSWLWHLAPLDLPCSTCDLYVACAIWVPHHRSNLAPCTGNLESATGLLGSPLNVTYS